MNVPSSTTPSAGSEDAAYNPAIPRSVCPGVQWPALPGPADAVLLALYYQMEESEWWPPHVLQAAQLLQLRELLEQARLNVPFYRQRLPDIGTDGLTPEAWQKIPILSRAEIQEAGIALHNTALPPEHQPVGETVSSGSDGHPVRVLIPRTSGCYRQAVELRLNSWYEREPSWTFAAVRFIRAEGLQDYEPGGSFEGWVPAYPSRPGFLFDVLRPVDEQLRWLVEIDPEHLLTFPSNLAALLRHSAETGLKPASLRQVLTTGEVLDEAVRGACSEVWGVPLLDVYACGELGSIALQCPEHDGYHVYSENLLVEILDDQGEPCRPGETGRVVVTDLHNLAMPLIRYALGDHAEAGEPCPCGRGLPVIRRIRGRTRNMVTLRDGTQFWPVFRPVWDVVNAEEFGYRIKQMQVIQKDYELLEARVVAQPRMNAQQETIFVEALQGAFHHPFRVRIQYMDGIPRSANGRFEDFKSEATLP